MFLINCKIIKWLHYRQCLHFNLINFCYILLLLWSWSVYKIKIMNFSQTSAKSTKTRAKQQEKIIKSCMKEKNVWSVYYIVKIFQLKLTIVVVFIVTTWHLWWLHLIQKYFTLRAILRISYFSALNMNWKNKIKLTTTTSRLRLYKNLYLSSSHAEQKKNFYFVVLKWGIQWKFE